MSDLAAFLTSINRRKPALLNVELGFGIDHPFVMAVLAQRIAFGRRLAAERNNVTHYIFSLSRPHS